MGGVGAFPRILLLFIGEWMVGGDLFGGSPDILGPYWSLSPNVFHVTGAHSKPSTAVRGGLGA